MQRHLDTRKQSALRRGGENIHRKAEEQKTRRRMEGRGEAEVVVAAAAVVGSDGSVDA
jgi:hypothetical protein